MDFIEINNLSLYAFHGVFDEEKSLGQEFIINAKIFTDLQKAGISDNLADSINYGSVCADIKNCMDSKKVNLLENAAENIILILFEKYSEIKKIELTILKPNAPVPLKFKTLGITIKRKRHTAYIGVGSNMGDKKEYLDKAFEDINKSKYCTVKKKSSYIITKPVGYTEQDDFLNAVFCIETIYEPHELLAFLQSIENSANRKRIIHWGPRTLDLDILLFDDLIISTETLTIPHPQMHHRKFVLEPLVEIAPYAYNPVLHKFAYDLLDEVKDE